MFVLEGGPREGQLVDELPTGYMPVPADAGPVRVVLFEDFIARKAQWIEGAGDDEAAADRTHRRRCHGVGT